MGKRGKPGKQKSGGGLGGLLSSTAKSIGGGGKGTGGMSGGLYRVNSRTGEIVKVQQKRRRRSFRMPRVVSEQIRASNELTRSLATAVILAGVNK